MTEEKLRELLDSLTMTEKIGQLVQVPGEVLNASGQELGVREELGISEEIAENAGSTLNVVGADQIRRVQTEYLSKSRHKIPLLFMADIIYGFRTVFPIPLALGCTFEPELLERLGEVTSKESVAAGAHVTFSPMADLVRDDRWGRCLESPGEDPYMNCRYTAALVKGFQKGMDGCADTAEGASGEEACGKDAGSGKTACEKDGAPGKNAAFPKGMASCVKHFAAYGAPEGGRDYNTVDMSERRLRQEYLPAYRAGVEAGCEMIMTSFNTVDGIPSTGNKWLMKDVLRGEWGFQGVVITDYAAIAELIAHGVAEDAKEAACLAMEAGVDIDMCTGCYANNLEELIREGRLTQAQLDDAVLRVLRLKNKLGLFEDPFRGADAAWEREEAEKPSHRALARRIAAKSMVLLENKEDTLPLAAEGKLALIGPYADNQNALGMWAIHGDRTAVVTLKQAFEEERVELFTAPGCETMRAEDYTDLPVLQKRAGKCAWDEGKRKEELQKALAAAEGADVAILALGEDEEMGGEGGSRTRLTIPGDQMELLRRVRERAKKVVAVVFAGRPLILDEVKELADAVLLVWYPGTEGGHAVCDLLFGRCAPEGRLSMSLPRSVGQLPLYYNAFSTGRPYDGVSPDRFYSRYTDCANTPLYPYGYGLGYHKAEYGPVSLSSRVLRKGEEITASVRIANVGSRAGVETAQLYIRDVTGSVVRPVKELKGVCKVRLEPGEEKTVSFVITEEMLRFYGKDMQLQSEPGKFRVTIAADSSAVPREEFVLED